MLTVNEIKKPKYHQYIVTPADSLAFPKQNAKATSNKPAIIKMIQLTIFCAKVWLFDQAMVEFSK